MKEVNASYKEMLKEQMKLVIARFERTRTVSVVDGPHSGEKVMICDCNFFVKYGLACRHMYTVICRYPKIQDALPRWLIAFIHCYGRNEIISRRFVELNQTSDKRGVPLSADDWASIDEQLRVGDTSSMPIEYFTCSLGKLRLCRPNYWQRIADKVVAKCGFDRSVLGSIQDATKPSSIDDVTCAHECLTVPMKKSNVSVAPIGVEQNIECSSDYKVPSQLYEEQCEESVEDVSFDTNMDDYSDETGIVIIYSVVIKEAVAICTWIIYLFSTQ